MATRTLEITFIGDASPATRAFDQVAGAGGKLGLQMDGVSSAFENVATVATGVLAANLTGKVASAFTGTFTAARDFERAIDQVGAVSRASEKDLGTLASTAKVLGAETQFSALDAAAAMEELAAGGRSVAQIVGGEARASVTLAAAGNYGLAESARTVATTMDIWKGTAISTTDVVNRLAGAANSSRFGVEDMAGAIAQGGGVMAAAGVSFEDFSTAIAATASSFASGADAGTSFKTFITALPGNSDKAKEAIAELGLKFYEANGAMRPMSAIVQELHDKLGPLSQEQQAVALKVIFGNDAFRTAAGLMQLTADEFQDMSDAMGDTSALDVAAQRTDNLTGDMEEFSGSMETIGITLGERVNPGLRALAQGGTEVANAFLGLPASTQNLSVGLAGIGVALPIVIPLMTRLKDVAQGMSTWMGTASGKLTAVGVGIGGLVVAADFALQKFSGRSLWDHLFGDVQEMEAAEEAARRMAGALYGVEENTTRVTIAQGLLAKAVDDAYAVLSKPAPFGHELARQDAVFDELRGTVKAAGQAMVDAGADAETLRFEYELLPDAVRGAFDEVTNVTQIVEQAAEKERLHTEKMREKNIELLSTPPAAGAAASAIDIYGQSLEDAEEAAKQLSEEIDRLAGRFLESNPSVISWKGQLAFAKDELADLNRNGIEWSTTLGKTKGEIEASITALEDQIAAAKSNSEAVKGMRDELELYIGQQGLAGLDQALANSKMSLEGQVDMQGLVADAYRKLADNDIPGFRAALDNISDRAPEIKQIVLDNIGPGLVADLAAVVPQYQDVGGQIGAGIGEGVRLGILGTIYGIQIAAQQAGNAATTAMQNEVQVQSPSKVTYKIGIHIGEGLAFGIQDSIPMVEDAAKWMVSKVVDVMDTSPLADLYANVPDYVKAYSPAAGGKLDFSSPGDYKQSYIGGGQYGYEPVQPQVGDWMGFGQAAVQWDGKRWVQGGMVNSSTFYPGMYDRPADGTVIQLVVDGQVLADVVNRQNARGY